MGIPTAHFPVSTREMSSMTDGLHRAVVAMGSNIGDRIAHIESALSLMKKKGLNILSVSPLYETKAMYYENQNSFINGACLIETKLTPIKLLDLLQSVENESGRVRKIEKGPRTLDLDIVLYDTEHIDLDRLKVPHPLMLEREFVMRPLADILPNYILPKSFTKSKLDPDGNQSIPYLLSQIQDSGSPMLSITTLKPGMPLLRADSPERSTHIMAVLNITPDSFSDGGVLYSGEMSELMKKVRTMIEQGASILDIGGQSTRPDSTLLTVEEELKRIMPVVQMIRDMPEAKHVAISIDTFYAEVARRTIENGADIINDISAGLMDPKMLPTVAELGKTIVLMHMRGTPQTMTKLCQYPGGVVNQVGDELAARLDAAQTAGIMPWRIILDPGIGFAKNQGQNLELLKQGASLRNFPVFRGLPWLVGTSRKGFIGKITGIQNAQERGWGTAAAVTAAIAGGADIVRVHDVPEMVQVAKMADAIYRQSG